MIIKINIQKGEEEPRQQLNKKTNFKNLFNQISKFIIKCNIGTNREKQANETR